MNAAYVSAIAALAGSVIGGLTTFAVAWVTQRQQANVQWLLQEKTRRQELYQQFIEDVSKLYVDALMHDQVAIPSLVSLYASMNKMKIVSSPARRRRRRQDHSNDRRHLFLTEQDLARAARNDDERRAGPIARL
jgi:broad specificity polyphosphatase/5'/3'-nucleotidase SurE